MELLFVAIGGFLLGLIARYAIRGRETHGVLLLPLFGAAVASGAWVALTWSGLAWDGGIIWWVTFALTAAASVAAALYLGPARRRQDAVRLEELSRPRP